jgi:nucleotide-binding universal stress UspA family protein
MNPQRILLPINVAKCPLEVFELANGIARRPGVTVILLHVLDLNILAQGNSVYEELGRAAARDLERLARACLPARSDIRIHILTGRPADEILAEARAAQVDLIILPGTQPSFWKRLFAPIVAPTVEKVIRTAPCTVLVAKVKTFFNCQKAWGGEGRETNAALDYPRRISEATNPEFPATAASSAPQSQQHPLAVSIWAELACHRAPAARTE